MMDSLSPTTEPAVSELLVASDFLCSPCEIVGGGKREGTWGKDFLVQLYKEHWKLGQHSVGYMKEIE